MSASDTDSSSRKPPPDAKTYYGYLFEADKKPTKVLDALLRGVAGYIVRLLSFLVRGLNGGAGA